MRKIFDNITALIASLLVFLLPLFSLIYNYNFHVFLSKYFSNEQNKFILRHIVRFFRGEIEISNVFFTDQALAHLKDVKVLVIHLQSFIFALFVALIILIIVYERHRISFPFKRTSIFSFTLVGLFSASTLFFSKFFYYFHKVAFRNELWLFPNDELLINLYTQDFFKWFLITSLAISFLIAIILFILSKNESK